MIRHVKCSPNAQTVMGPIFCIAYGAQFYVILLTAERKPQTINEELNVSIVSYNINGTKDIDDSIDYLISINNIVCQQEHLLCTSSVNFLNQSKDLFHFVVSAGRTRGHPSSGLACMVNKRLSHLSPVQ